MKPTNLSGTDPGGRGGFNTGRRGWAEQSEGSSGHSHDRSQTSVTRSGNTNKTVMLERTADTSQFSGLSIASVIAASAGLLFLVAPDIGLPLRLFMIAIVLLSLRFWGGVLVLVAVQADLFLREPKRGAAFSGLIGLLTVFLILSLLMFINRNRDLLQRVAKRRISAFVTTVVAVFRGEVTVDSGKAFREITRMIGAAIRGVAVLITTVFVSRVLLSILPTPHTFNQNLREWITNDAFIPGCSLLLVGIVALWSLCNEISWRQMTRDQARIYLRSVLLLSHHADLRMIVRGRLKSRRQAARKRRDVDAAPGQLNKKNFAGQNE